MSDTLYDATIILLEKIIGLPVNLEEKMPLYAFETPVIAGICQEEKVIIKGMRRINWQRVYGLMVPTYDQMSWYEIAIKDELPDGTFYRERMRHSEADRLERFLGKFDESRLGGHGNEEFYSVLGNEQRVKDLTRLVMEENYKNGRSI